MKDLQYELRDSIYEGYSFIDKIEGEEGFTITKLEDENIEDVEEMIFRANMYNEAIKLIKKVIGYNKAVHDKNTISPSLINELQEFLNSIK